MKSDPRIKPADGDASPGDVVEGSTPGCLQDDQTDGEGYTASRDVSEPLDDDARCLVEALRPAAGLGAAFVILLSPANEGLSYEMLTHENV